MSERRLDAVTDDPGVADVGAVLCCALIHQGLEAVRQPPIQVVTKGQAFVVEYEATFPVRHRLRQFLRHIRPGLTVARPSFTLPLCRVHDVLGHPPAVLAAAYTALAVTPLAQLRFLLSLVLDAPNITLQSLIF